MTWLFVFIAALLIPEAAHAGFISTAISVALAASSAGAGFGAALAAGFGVITTSFVGKLLVGTALSLVGQLFAKKPPGVKEQGIQTEQTTTGDTTPQKFIVGKYAAEGHAVAPAYSRNGGDPNSILTYILEISNIPVKGLTGRAIVDGQYVNFGQLNAEDPNRQDFTEFGVDDAGNPYGWLWFYDGTQTTAQFKLVEAYASHPDRPWTTDHVLRNTAYAVCEFVFNQEIYSGLPAIRFEVEGIALYDPRKDTSVGGSGAHRWNDPSTWEFTQNPQVINYNILRGITLPSGDIWGGQVPAEDLPLDNWFAAMNECDVLIGDRPQYQAGFEVNVGEMEPFSVIQEMNRASFAQMSEFGGVFRVRVGAPAAAVMSLTDADFAITEPSNYNPFPGLAETYNAVNGTYVEPNDVWEGRSADAILNSQWEADDGGRRLTVELNLPAVSNKSQAQQLLTAYIKDQRRFRTHRMVLPPSFALLEPLDTIEWTSEVNGYTNKIFEVISVEHRPDTLLQAVTVRERDAGDTVWTSGDDVAGPVSRLDLTPPSSLIPFLTVTAVDIPDGDGTARRPAIKLAWEQTRIAELIKYEIRVVGTTDIITSGVEATALLEKTTSDGIISDVPYEARARFIIPGRPTDWTAWIPVRSNDTRLTTADFVDSLIAQLNDAFAVSSTALDSVESGPIFELLQEVRIQDAILAAQDVSNSAQDVVAFEESGDNAAAIVTEQIARADADSAIASDVTTLTARVGTAEGNISTINAVKVDANGAVAAVEQEISATYNGMTAMATATAFAEATADNIASGYVWRLNGQNLLELVSTQVDSDTGPTSTFQIAADYVQIQGTLQAGDTSGGLFVNTSSLNNAVYVYQDQALTYALFGTNKATGGGAGLFESEGGFTLQVVNFQNGTSARFGDWTAIDAQTSAAGGGRGKIGLSTDGGGYGFDAITGGYNDTSGAGYLPFTGVHEGMMCKGANVEPGDIVVDTRVILRSVSDSFTEVEPSTELDQPAAIGVFSSRREWVVPSAFVDRDRLAEDGHRVSKVDLEQYKTDFDLVRINSVGEGAINVCGRGGDIQAGDLIVASPIPGKGQRQADNFVRSCTVAKAREAVAFASPDEVRMIACIYLCG